MEGAGLPGPLGSATARIHSRELILEKGWGGGLRNPVF